MFAFFRISPDEKFSCVMSPSCFDHFSKDVWKFKAQISGVDPGSGKVPRHPNRAGEVSQLLPPLKTK